MKNQTIDLALHKLKKMTNSYTTYLDMCNQGGDWELGTVRFHKKSGELG